jgi:prepilin-type N-terminal cleavage/methylation domain-containing protein
MKKIAAFSLIELSIVLVILGLLTGGILAGRSLIHAAEIRSVTTEYQRYAAAAHSFRDKYYMLPGDINNAQQFWGTDPNCPGDYAHPSVDQRTCNGNGDGSISGGGGGPEHLRFWQHLANAGLIEGQYTGVSSDAKGYIYGVVGPIDVPLSKAGGEWLPMTLGDIPVSSPSYYDGSYGTVLTLAWWNSVLTGENFQPLRPEDAWNIDTKLDDGKPASGKIRSQENTSPTCNTGGSSTTASLASTAAYNVSDDSPKCMLVFLNAM